MKPNFTIEPIDIAIYANDTCFNIAVNEALLRQGAKTTIDDITRELDRMRVVYEIKIQSILEVIGKNLQQMGSFVNPHEVFDYYVEAAICFYCLNQADPVQTLKRLASEEYTNEDFIRIENEELLPLGGGAVDYNKY